LLKSKSEPRVQTTTLKNKESKNMEHKWVESKMTEYLVGAFIIVIFSLAFAGIFAFLSSVSKDIEKSRIGQKVEYWLSEPSENPELLE
jgi:hypothetical protein